ncbi:ABC transporter permease [Acidocella aminolytica]|uniref:ABC transporter permease n=1 Tax=Acidocella aminolytica TaxID=33998 RepID=UPI0006623941|nr:iron ABC transporter permease [Acidocella aminolytica]GBQ32661.1 ferric iron ABC transporter permease [Acidocella aminolytica 101 = DSM 11237]SHF34414.1 iron(III) transport system permease protein [Acidocella aminolytica 101 = DSM 11237]
MRWANARPPLLLLGAAAVGAFLVLLPIGLTILRATEVSGGQAAHFLLRPLVGTLLLNTVCLTAVSSALAIVVGTGAAWFVERTRLPGRQAWAVLLAVPLAIPSFITSYAWISISPALEGFAGAVLVVTCAYYPLLYLPVAASLRNLDPALEDSARALGCGPVVCFVRVVLPQLHPALLGGTLLVALNVLTEFGAFALLRFRTFTTEIYIEYRASFDGATGSLLASILIVLCLFCLMAELRIRGSARYGRIGRGVRRPASLHELGQIKWVVVALLAALVVVTTGMPLITTLYWMTQHGAAAITPAEVSPALLTAATLSSLGYGLGGTLIAMVLAIPIGFLATRYRGRTVTLVERTSYLTQGMPGIVIALAMVFLTVHYLHPLYQSSALLILVYGIQFLSLAVVGVRAALAHAQLGLEEAARSLGLNVFQVAYRVMLPLAGPGLGAAAAMVFIAVVTELTATLLLAPIGTQTLATQVWADTSTLAFAAAAPYAAIMMALSLTASWLLARQFGQSRVGDPAQSHQPSQISDRTAPVA